MVYLLVVVTIAAIGAAAAFYFQYAALKAQDESRRREAESASASASEARKELEGAKQELGRKKAEATELREKLTELRQKTHKQREADRKQKSASAASVESQLEDALRKAEEEESRADVLQREATGLQQEVLKLREQTKKLEESYKAAQAAYAAAAARPATPAAAPAVAVAAPQKTDDELKARVDLLEGQLRDARKKAAIAEDETKKARAKSSTAARMQLLTKSELDLFREKLVWSEKRVVEIEKLLFDNKIALPEREPAPQPAAPQVAPGILARESANTGGEGVVAGGADYVPEEPVAAEVTPAPAEAAAPVAAVAGVPPIRRPRTEVADAKAE